ncbi:MAG: methyltransferase domain-containing protein, partial [Myxococcales bacterium]|nr:methyltransferase domain-containing protein [Myxococcales bacterium]
MQDENPKFAGWQYASRGDYHRTLDPNWSYTPTYLRKRVHLNAFLDTLAPGSRTIDVGCGEGVFVEHMRERSFDAIGLDLNYQSELVKRGSVLDIPFASESFDAALFMDVLEHLKHSDQVPALSEIRRVLKPGGGLFLTVPNLAHLNSRLRLILRGKLDRTDKALEHLGERPYWENVDLIEEAGFEIIQTRGITLTLPIVYRRLICRHAAKLRWLHDAME